MRNGWKKSVKKLAVGPGAEQVLVINSAFAWTKESLNSQGSGNEEGKGEFSAPFPLNIRKTMRMYSTGSHHILERGSKPGSLKAGLCSLAHNSVGPGAGPETWAGTWS